MKYRVCIGKDQVTVEGSPNRQGSSEQLRVDGERRVLDPCTVPGGVSLIVDGHVFDMVFDNGVAYYKHWKAAVTTDPASASSPSKAPNSQKAERVYRAPMPGLVVTLGVKVGDNVTVGQVLLTIEAMKMENELRAHTAGSVVAVHVESGMRVAQGAPLVEIG